MEDTSAFAKAQTKKIKCAIGFYNLENLFDTKNDPATLDDDFTPGGFKEWNSYKFDKKVKKLAKVISKIGKKSQTTYAKWCELFNFKYHCVQSTKTPFPKEWLEEIKNERRN